MYLNCKFNSNCFFVLFPKHVLHSFRYIGLTFGSSYAPKEILSFVHPLKVRIIDLLLGISRYTVAGTTSALNRLFGFTASSSF